MAICYRTGKELWFFDILKENFPGLFFITVFLQLFYSFFTAFYSFLQFFLHQYSFLELIRQCDA